MFWLFGGGLVSGCADSSANEMPSVLLGKKCDSGTQRGDRCSQDAIFSREDS